MLLKQVLEIFELLDDPHASGQAVRELFISRGADEVTVTRVGGRDGSTDCISVRIAGKGKTGAPTLGIIGRLGGLGARPAVTGFVSDGDGALAALSAALKLIEMRKRGDILPCDVIVSTHICPDAPTEAP